MLELNIQTEIKLKNFTTFRMGPVARFFAVVKSPEELHSAFVYAKQHSLNTLILGSGSNILIDDSAPLEALVLKIEIPGFDILSENNEVAVIKVGAGEVWDNVVKQAVELNLWGIEALSWIPGTAGATPVQNVGAYGSEVADVLVSLEAYEIETCYIKHFSKEDCQFNYRDSVFKHEANGKYVITSLTIKLSKVRGTVPDYPGVKKYFDENKIVKPSLQQIREAIIDIRNFKLPDPKEVASVGSFFKNPIITRDQHLSLKELYPNIVAFELDNGNYKIGAGWMLETLGLKGERFGQLQFYKNNALVLTNLGDTTFQELEKLAEEIKAKTKTEFGIDLEIEPIIIKKNAAL